MLNSALDARLRPNFDDDRDADTFLLRLERYSPELIGSLEAAYGPERTPALLDEVLRLKPASAKGIYLKKISVSATQGPGVPVDPSVQKNYATKA